MKHAFVTGGSGFVGRALIPALVARGVAVRALARSDLAAAAVTAGGATAVRGELDDGTAMIAGMADCDVVIHAAAYAKQHGPLAEFMRANVEGTENVLTAARAAGVRRVVHISTEAVLADGRPIIRADETRPRAAKPAGPYPLTKGLAEAAALAAEGIEVVVVRPRFVWGKGDTTLLPELIEAVTRGKFAWIGGGHYLTSTCHIDNVIEGTIAAAERGRPGEIYFLTDGEPVEFRGFITELLATQGVTVGGRSIPRWVARAIAAVTARMKTPPVTRTALALVGHEVTVVDAKARRELGYTGAVTRAAGLAAMRAT
ncbi:MAG: NAD-dependent epimerase/dehydratase family protein [Deltaproteobacteria bacterium]|nr:NAD-dependent epimerase/dehydratase family protein [Deltaproteobacteria bacterium]